MKHMSFFLTTPQVRARTKTATRRLGWLQAKVGDRVMGVEKGQGLKKGEKVVRLGVIEFTHVSRQRLDDILWMGKQECIAEGFPAMTTREFVAMFCRHNKVTPRRKITRIEFKYID